MMLTSLLAGVGLARIGTRMRVPQWVAPALVTLLLLATVPSVRAPYRDGGQLVALAQNAVVRWMRTDAAACRPALLFQFPTAFVVEGLNGLSGGDPAALWPSLRERSARGDIDGAWWLELRDTGRGLAFPHMEPPPGFRVDTLAELPLKSGVAVRVSALDRDDGLARQCRPGSVSLGPVTRPGA
jgi:hypothetical protein